MALDSGRRVDRKTWNKQMEDEGVEYGQMSGVGETEHTAVREQTDVDVRHV